MRHASRRTAVAAPMLAAWATACFAVRPYQPPRAGAEGARRGERVRVALPPSTLVHVRSAAGDTSSVAAARFTGTVVEVRGDTIVLGDVSVGGTSLHFAGAGGADLSAATALLTPENHARLTARSFSPLRTAALVVGLTVVAAGIALAVAIASISADF